MECVYTAFEDHLAYLNLSSYWLTYEEYSARKFFAHRHLNTKQYNKPHYTFSGIVPWLYHHMLYAHNLLTPANSPVIEMKIQRQWITLLEYMKEGTEEQQQIMYNTPYWGEVVDEITLAPAIYCLLNEHHAEFMEKPPTHVGARIIMAIQLVKFDD